MVKIGKFKIYDKSKLDDVLYKQQWFEMRLMRNFFREKLANKNHVNITVLSL